MNFVGREPELNTLSILHKLGHPVAVAGPTGDGKTFLVKHWANKNGKQVLIASGSSGASLESLVGQWIAQPQEGGGFYLEWQDGILSIAVRDGHIALIEELSRVPQDILGRIFSLTDTENPFYSIPEKGGDDAKGIPIHENFRFMATFNGVASGYFVSKVDEAFLDRFYVMELDYLPVEVEYELVQSLGVDSDVARKMADLADLTRLHKEDNSVISTRDLVMWAQLHQEGVGIKDSFKLAIGAKKKESVINHMKDIFGNV